MNAETFVVSTCHLSRQEGRVDFCTSTGENMKESDSFLCSRNHHGQAMDGVSDGRSGRSNWWPVRKKRRAEQR